MNNFNLYRADSVDNAFKTKSHTENSKFIGGGTNLVDLMKYRVENPDTLIDINKLGLSDIEEIENEGLRLGATATNADTAYNDTVETDYPLLSEAILAGASTQLRNMATNGGNLLQRTRCYYFYDTSMACNKRDPGSGCAAVNGFNRIHAILGTSDDCIATHPSDMCVALAALDATINVTGPNGNRSIPILKFHRLPGDNPQIDTTLEDDEIITSIDLPKKGFSKNYGYLKVRDRPSYAFALVSAAVGLELEGDTIKDIRIALGGVAHKPWRDVSIEKEFIGKKAEPSTFKSIAEKLLQGAKGFGDNDFKIQLAKNTIVRALTEASEK
ncbi:xanthine dehydrogenase YagS FAD-binding subunit [Flavobacteriaceae bacterium MAR_2010_188]|nr:xanthine dehydrogenase YagS FAD-binding subunit [Flavobacteriaceae bacterium MAR_2010_188]